MNHSLILHAARNFVIFYVQTCWEHKDSKIASCGHYTSSLAQEDLIEIQPIIKGMRGVYACLLIILSYSNSRVKRAYYGNIK